MGLLLNPELVPSLEFSCMFWLLCSTDLFEKYALTKSKLAPRMLNLPNLHRVERDKVTKQSNRNLHKYHTFSFRVQVVFYPKHFKHRSWPVVGKTTGRTFPMNRCYLNKLKMFEYTPEAIEKLNNSFRW